MLLAILMDLITGAVELAMRFIEKCQAVIYISEIGSLVVNGGTVNAVGAEGWAGGYSWTAASISVNCTTGKNGNALINARQSIRNSDKTNGTKHRKFDE